jgi:tryptophanyl-tRNA synthetase
MVPSLEGRKMSASNPNSKIDLLNLPEVVQKNPPSTQLTVAVMKGNEPLTSKDHNNDNNDTTMSTTPRHHHHTMMAQRR